MKPSSLAATRQIHGAHEIPRLGWVERVGLLRVQASDEALMARSGASKGAKGWTIGRSPGVRLDLLERFLPRFARKGLIPDIIDLIPETSWCASLANILAPSSWKLLRDAATIYAGGCEECGARDRLECHEAWHYDDDKGVQRLMRLRTLCGPCHETCHLGFASVRGRYAAALERLVALNRLHAEEVAAYEQLIFEKFEERSQREWELDLGFLRGHGLRLKKTFRIASPGVICGDRRGGRTVVAISGANLVESPRGIVLT